MKPQIQIANDPLHTRLKKLRDCLLKDLIERDTPIRLALLAALSGEHLLLIGPPGTAKSEMARRLRGAFRHAAFFERLLTRFSVPEELFGPLSIRGLEEDRYQRLTQGYLPCAEVAFLDEIFKANSAILNSLLTLLNEREFDNGTKREKAPLICVIGASNELPEGEEMAALYDRFLLRCHVPPVSKGGFAKLIGLRGNTSPEIPLEFRLSQDDLREFQKAAALVKVPDSAITLLSALRDFTQDNQIAISDRRWRKIVFLLQVSAYTNNRNEVTQWDGWLLQHCAWEEPEQEEKIADWYRGFVGATEAEPERFTRLVNALEKRLRQDQESRSQAHDKEGNPLFDDGGKPTANPRGRQRKADPSGEFLYLGPRGDGWSSPDRTNSGRGYTRAALERLIRSNR